MLKSFFTSYKSSFIKFDSREIASHYQCPVTFYTESGESMNFDKRHLVRNLESLLKMYRKLDVVNAEFKVIACQNISEHFKLATVDWLFLNSKNAVIYETLTKYILQGPDNSVKINAVFVIDESEKYGEALESLRAKLENA